MKSIVFGARGTVGQHLVSQSLAAGDQVTAFGRQAGKAQAGLTWVEGDVLDAASVHRAVAGHDVVFCALGAGRRGGVRATGTRHIIEGMKAHNIRRLICQTTLGAGDSAGNLNFFWKYIMFGLLLKPAFEDHQLQEQIIRASDLDWTIVRPGAFIDGPVTGQYKHGFSGDTQARLKLKISRADVAHFMREQLNSRQYLRATPGLSY
jgi:putative NADH-flavin reductase